ncbi:MAG: PIN domain-containing protein [Chloroflexi bacterium]|nr:PIN domain-containing protein [Chloroflexota bacterium]
MARYLLDTTALIDQLKGRRPVAALLAQLSNDGHELAVCAVNIAELYSGLFPWELSHAEQFLQDLAYYDIRADDARRAGTYRNEFARKGVTLSLADMLVAAVAVGRGACLVTANPRHFPMQELKLLEHP